MTGTILSETQLTRTPTKYRLGRADTDELASLDGATIETRDTWEAAAEDAVRFGVGKWLNRHEFKLDYPYQIKAVR